MKAYDAIVEINNLIEQLHQLRLRIGREYLGTKDFPVRLVLDNGSYNDPMLVDFASFQFQVIRNEKANDSKDILDVKITYRRVV